MTTDGLSDLLGEIDDAVDRSAEGAVAVLDMRARLAQYVSDPRFVTGCVDAVLTRIERVGRWDNEPLHRDERRAYLVRVLYWPAGYRNLPHEHLTWTVAGVLRGCLNVCLWDPGSASSDTDPIVRRTLAVRAGETGYLQPPCIHSFENPGADTAVSLHVVATSHAASGEHRPATSHSSAHVDWFGREDRGSLGVGAGRRVLLANVAMAASLGDAGVPTLLRCFNLGDRTVKLAAARAAARLSPDRGAELVSRLASVCGGSDRARLLDIAGRLASSRGG
jgi:predicted metal-dependent enzyme (double-stranded beta helix superfamily)